VAIAEPVNIAAEVVASRSGLVHADTLAGTTEALRQWLAMGESENLQIKQCAVRLFSERFDFSTVATNLVAVLQSAIPAHSSFVAH
jgi:hypothetical protein